jgi:hypothetical protein
MFLFVGIIGYVYIDGNRSYFLSLYNFHLVLDRVLINHITMILTYEGVIINSIVPQNVQMKTITGTQIFRNGKINWHST